MFKLLLLLLTVSGGVYFFILPDTSIVESTVGLADKKADQSVQSIDTENIEVSDKEENKADQVKNIADLPTPDELWEKQQSKLAERPVARKANVIKEEEILTPDEIWKLRNQDNSEDDLPATFDVMPVISDELKMSEDAYASSVKLDAAYHDELTIGNTRGDELPASEDFLEVMTFELQESENDAASRKLNGYDNVYQEPMIDLVTGLSEEESMKMEDELPPIESSKPVD